MLPGIAADLQRFVGMHLRHSPGETGTAPAFAGSSGTAREK